ncbi:MAG: Nucleolar protein 12 [Bathelium mastoideum]|nr:MAG: Nucleolar protein 12 [Bathelium mastoideum]
MKDTARVANKKKRSNGDDLNGKNSSADSALASLFASSAGPVSAPSRNRLSQNQPSRIAAQVRPLNEKDLPNRVTNSEATSVVESSEPAAEQLAGQSRRKRKSRSQDEDIEDAYFRRLAQGDEGNEVHETHSLANKRPRIDRSVSADSLSNDDDFDLDSSGSDGGSIEDQEEGAANGDEENGADAPPLHESLMPEQTDSEVEKASRTVFLGNVSSLAIASKSAYRQLITHISTVLQSPSLPSGTHKIESLRFRSTAYASKIPKKGAFAKKDLMNATTKSTNAYVVYTTQSAARKAAKTLNGTIVLDRHLRADLVAHPAKVDHRRCVFVGNLGFVDDETSINDADEDGNGAKHAQSTKSKNKEPGDVEEGLWREFGKVGTVQSVRVVRDPKTRVGKGFAYVQYADENAVEAALLYNDKKFPPLLPRKLRVTRARSIKRNASTKSRSKSNNPTNVKTRASTGNGSLVGRARKILGKAGARALQEKSLEPRVDDSEELRTVPRNISDKLAQIKAPESFVFEGHRANSRQKPSGLKLNKKGKTKGKSRKSGRPKTRSANRAAAWKAKGSK